MRQDFRIEAAGLSPRSPWHRLLAPCSCAASFPTTATVLPGLFVRVRVPLPEPRATRCLVPGDAISFDQQGEYLLVVDDKNVVERRSVKAGFQVGDMMVIDDGLQAGRLGYRRRVDAGDSGTPRSPRSKPH